MQNQPALTPLLVQSQQVIIHYSGPFAATVKKTKVVGGGLKVLYSESLEALLFCIIIDQLYLFYRDCKRLY